MQTHKEPGVNPGPWQSSSQEGLSPWKSRAQGAFCFHPHISDITYQPPVLKQATFKRVACLRRWNRSVDLRAEPAELSLPP